MPYSSLKGKVIAITGGANGIGLSLAHLLAAEGAILSLADNQQAPLEAAGAAIARTGAKAMTTVLDVRDSAQVTAWIEDTVKAFGRLDGAVNLAGVFRCSGPISSVSDEDWDFIMDINVGGLRKCLRAQLAVMERQVAAEEEERKVAEAKAGVKVERRAYSIVNAASAASLGGTALFSPYVTSKHAVLGLTRCAAKEGAEKNIRVNAICPGIVNTTLISDVEKTIGRPLPVRNPMGRFAEPDEVSKSILFLLSDDSGFITGTAFSIDGGTIAGP